jgi:hypothetical protein
VRIGSVFAVQASFAETFFSNPVPPSRETFWNGATGWRDRQLPDGTVVWTSPTGHTYTTYPGSLHLFPTLCAPTATLWTGESPTTETSADRGVMMPKRRYTRARTTAKTIAAERRLNDPYVAERNKPPPF